MKKILLLILLFIGCTTPNTGISSNPNFFKGIVINEGNSSIESAQIISYNIDNYSVVAIDTSHSDESGNFEIDTEKDSYIEIKKDQNIGYYSLSDTTIHEFPIKKYASYTSSAIKIADDIDDTKIYQAVLLKTPYRTDLQTDLTFSFDSIPMGTYDVRLIEVDSTGEMVSTLNNFSQEITLNPGDSVVNVQVLDSIIYTVDSTNFEDTYIKFSLKENSKIIDDENFSQEKSITIGFNKDSIEYRALIKLTLDDSIYNLNIKSAFIKFIILIRTFDFNYNVYQMIKEWKCKEITALKDGLGGTWTTKGIGLDNIEAKQNEFENITINELEDPKSNVYIPIKNWINNADINNGILLVPESMASYVSFYSLEADKEENRPKIKIYYYRDK